MTQAERSQATGAGIYAGYQCCLQTMTNWPSVDPAYQDVYQAFLDQFAINMEGYLAWVRSNLGTLAPDEVTDWDPSERLYAFVKGDSSGLVTRYLVGAATGAAKCAQIVAATTLTTPPWDPPQIAYAKGKARDAAADQFERCQQSQAIGRRYGPPWEAPLIN